VVSRPQEARRLAGSARLTVRRLSARPLAARIHGLHRAESGQALVIVLGLVTFLFLTGTALAAQASLALRAGAANVSEASVLYAADAGGELGIWWQRNAKAGSPPPITINGVAVSTTVSTVASSGGSGAPWKQWGFGPSGSGASTSTGPAVYGARWATFPTLAQGTVVSSPVVAADGYVYVGATTGLYAYKPDGSLAWSFASASQSPAVGEFDGAPAILTTSGGARMIVAATNGTGTTSTGTYSTVFGLTENSTHTGVTIAWSYALAVHGASQGFVAAVKLNAAGSRAYIGAQNSTLYAFATAASGSATPLWTKTLTPTSTITQPVALNGDESKLYAVLNNHQVYGVLAADGTQSWTSSVAGGTTTLQPPVFRTVGGRDHVYLTTGADAKVRAYADLGTSATLDWTVDFSKAGSKANDPSWGPPAVRMSGATADLYVGLDNGEVWKIEDQGTSVCSAVACTSGSQWILTLAASNLRAAPAIDSSGALFMGNGAGSIYRIADAGSSATSLLWPVALGAVGSELVIGTDGDLYAMTGSGRLLAIGASLVPAVITVTAVAGQNTVVVVYSDAGSASPTLSTWTSTR
jgi:hypothetical protein